MTQKETASKMHSLISNFKNEVETMTLQLKKTILGDVFLKYVERMIDFVYLRWEVNARIEDMMTNFSQLT